MTGFFRVIHDLWCSAYVTVIPSLRVNLSSVIASEREAIQMMVVIEMQRSRCASS